MLGLNRYPSEQIYIYPDYSKVSPSTTVGEIFGGDGHIAVSIIELSGKKAKLGIDSPGQFAIMRSELDDIQQKE